MMQEYVISSPNLNDITVGFDPMGKLIKMEAKAGLEPKTWLAILKYVRDKAHFDIWLKDHKKSTTKVRALTIDLSFDTFYEQYDNKQGKKAAENAWKRLSKEDKAKALDYISTYNNKLARSGVAKKYPATYINQKTWED